MNISYICCYNNKEQLNSLLLPSMSKLKVHFISENNSSFHNLLLIDNRDGKYKSAASAFNEGIEAHSSQLGDILCFMHQDIAFDNALFQEELVSEFETDLNQIIGLCGKKQNDESYSNLRYYATKEFIVNHQISEKTEVECVDECCFAIPKKLFFKLMFDEVACYHWHLYAVDLCYNAKRRFGTKSFVAKTSIYHKMDGSSGLTIDHHFLSSLKKLTKKYRKDFKKIYAPCYTIWTNPFLAKCQIIKTNMEQKWK